MKENEIILNAKIKIDRINFVDEILDKADVSDLLEWLFGLAMNKRDRQCPRNIELQELTIETGQLDELRNNGGIPGK